MKKNSEEEEVKGREVRKKDNLNKKGNANFLRVLFFTICFFLTRFV